MTPPTRKIATALFDRQPSFSSTRRSRGSHQDGFSAAVSIGREAGRHCPYHGAKLEDGGQEAFGEPSAFRNGRIDVREAREEVGHDERDGHDALLIGSEPGSDVTGRLRAAILTSYPCGAEAFRDRKASW